ncbi:major facilitator superfamily domain-containing protein [Collybia nuda]|uniref:Major facilitator superfamily domain-containing protein n=1 Tax=Collybia nuda TaxID=64659 RepID=A0A9P5XU06_9AGAR|nr:major facilitator superfamily domain-containing protein [Collybia nuda]
MNTDDALPKLNGESPSPMGSPTISDEGTTMATTAPPVMRSTIKSVILVLSCSFAFLINTANNTIMSISLSTIGRELHIQEVQLQWLVSAYPLSAGCLLLIFGRLADLHGKKKTFLLGAFTLAAFTLGCGFANDPVTLDILRGFQGVGASAILPSSLGILAEAFPPSRARSIAFSVFAAGAPVGAAFGLAVGGVLTQMTKYTWRATFFMQAGLTAFCFIGGLMSIDPDKPSTEVDRRTDWLGAALVTVGLVLIVFVLGQGEVAPQQWATPYIIALLIVGVFLIVVFVFWQRYLEKVQNTPNAPYSLWTPPPLMKISVWGRARGRFAVMLIVAFLTWCSFFAWNLWVQLYYQNLLGYSALAAVLRLLPLNICGTICTVVVALLVGRISAIYLIVAGTLGSAVGALLFAVIKPEVTYWAYAFPSITITVVGVDLIFAAGSLFIAKISLPHEQGVAGALFQTMTQLGTAVGVAVSTVVFNRVSLRQPQRIPTLKSYQAAQWSAFAFGVLATILALVFFRGVGIVGQEKRGFVEDGDRNRLSESTGEIEGMVPRSSKTETV